MEVPPPHTTLCPPPLDEAIPLELYERCLAPQPAVKDEEQLENEETDVRELFSNPNGKPLCSCIHYFFIGRANVPSDV